MKASESAASLRAELGETSSDDSFHREVIKEQAQINEALSRVLGNMGTKAKLLGEHGNKDTLGNKEHKKINFRFFGNRGRDKPIYFRKTREKVLTWPRSYKTYSCSTEHEIYPGHKY